MVIVHFECKIRGRFQGGTDRTRDAAALASTPSVPLHRPFVLDSNCNASALAFIGRGRAAVELFN